MVEKIHVRCNNKFGVVVAISVGCCRSDKCCECRNDKRDERDERNERSEKKDTMII